ncbi:MAG: VTT domain-containing protein [Gammaproteobacteria bacterium]
MSIQPLILRGLLMVLLLVLLSALLGDVLDRNWIDVYIRGQGLAGQAMFIAATCLLMSLGLSRQLVAFLAGYGFGFLPGLLLSMIAVTTACLLTFSVARLLLRDFLLRYYSARIHRIDCFIHQHTFPVTLLFRLLPLGSNWLVNIAAGASDVRSVPFFLGSMLGYLPQMLIFALVGSGSRIGQFWQIALTMALLVAAAGLGYWLYGRYHRQGWLVTTESVSD